MKKRKRIEFRKLALFVILFILIVLGTFLFIKSQKKSVPSTVSKRTEQIVLKPTNQEGVPQWLIDAHNNTGESKVYSNKTYSFSVIIPSDWYGYIEDCTGAQTSPKDCSPRYYLLNYNLSSADTSEDKFPGRVKMVVTMPPANGARLDKEVENELTIWNVEGGTAHKRLTSFKGKNAYEIIDNQGLKVGLVVGYKDRFYDFQLISTDNKISNQLLNYFSFIN